jgi:hypothetical protein
MKVVDYFENSEMIQKTFESKKIKINNIDIQVTMTQKLYFNHNRNSDLTFFGYEINGEYARKMKCVKCGKTSLQFKRTCIKCGHSEEYKQPTFKEVYGEVHGNYVGD